MEWRWKWRRNWAQVKYCSKKCRNKGLTETDHMIEDTLLNLLDRYPDNCGMVPEAAVETMADASSLDRRQSLATAARNAARRLHNRGIIEILQNGHPVDPSHAKGPFHIRRRKA